MSSLFANAAADPCAELGPDRPKVDFRCRSGPVGAAVTLPSNGPMTGAVGGGRGVAKTQRQQPASKRHGACFGDRAALLSVRYFFLAPRRAIAEFMSSMEAHLEGRPNMPLRFLISASPLKASRS